MQSYEQIDITVVPDDSLSSSSSSTGSFPYTPDSYSSRSSSQRGRSRFRHSCAHHPSTAPNLSALHIPSDPALLSPAPYNTLLSRKHRSASSRSLRAASISGQSSQLFLEVPTRRRSTSVPPEPAPTLFQFAKQSRSSQPTSPPPEFLQFNESTASQLDPYNFNLPSSQSLPASDQDPLFNFDLPSDQTSPESPYYYLNNLFYSNSNSSSSSLVSQFSLNSHPSLPNSPIPPEHHSLFDTNPVPYPDNVGPSISIINADNSVTYPDVLSTIDPDLLSLFQPSADPDHSLLTGGQPSSFTTDPFLSAATSPADSDTTYHTPSPGSEQSFHSFDSPSPSEYMPLPPFVLSASQDSLASNFFPASQPETTAVNSTPSGGECPATGPGAAATAVQGVHKAQNFRSGLGQQILSPMFYSHCNRGNPTGQPAVHPHLHSSHHLDGVGDVGAVPLPGTVNTASFLGGPAQIFPSFSGLAAASHASSTASSSSSPRKLSVVPTNTSLNRPFGPKKQLYGRFSPAAVSPVMHGNMAYQEASSSSRKNCRVPIENNLDRQFEVKQRVYSILINSSSKDKACATVSELGRRMKSKLFEFVFGQASQHQVRSTAASRRSAEDRRRRQPTFVCILCQASFTTNNNLQNHYRSHLEMDQYQCRNCGRYFRTEGIRKRHTQKTQKCRGLDPS